MYSPPSPQPNPTHSTPMQFQLNNPPPKTEPNPNRNNLLTPKYTPPPSPPAPPQFHQFHNVTLDLTMSYISHHTHHTYHTIHSHNPGLCQFTPPYPAIPPNPYPPPRPRGCYVCMYATG